MTVPTFEVGTEIPALNIPRIRRATLALFAGASGDHHPIHIDIDFAHSVGYEDVFAHGMLTMAYLGRLLTNWIPQSDLRSFGGRFIAPVPINAELRCRGRITSRGENEFGLCVVAIDLTVNLADDTAVFIGDAIVAVPTDGR